MNCPGCQSDKLRVIEDEVDIGVGIQKHLIGWECEVCGHQIGACSFCGHPDFEPHSKWCDRETTK